MDELEGETDTYKLFLEQGTLEEAKQKELAEYIDAKNKEVNKKDNNGLNFRFFSFSSGPQIKVSIAWWTSIRDRMLKKIRKKWRLFTARSAIKHTKNNTNLRAVVFM